MSRPGPESNGAVLTWSDPLLTWEALRSRLNGLRELVLGPKTLVSPLLLDELRDRKITVRRDGEASSGAVRAAHEAERSKRSLGVAVQTSDGGVASAMEALKREGVELPAWQPKGATLAAWSWSLAHLVKEQGRGIAFTADAALVACLACKVAGVRAATVINAAKTSRAIKEFAANLLTVEIPGPTFFELKQILRAAATTLPASPGEVERVFKELDGHAHR